LNDNDLVNIRIIYLDNNYNFYIYDDIQQLVINKYGSISELQEIITKKKLIRKEKEKKRMMLIQERENHLKTLFQLNKLEFKNYGDCYSFIHYSIPDAETVIKNELLKNAERNNRRIMLANKLKHLNIPVDETLKSCYEYINNLTTKELNDIVRGVEIEYFIKHNTLVSKKIGKISEISSVCSLSL